MLTAYDRLCIQHRYRIEHVKGFYAETLIKTVQRPSLIKYQDGFNLFFAQGCLKCVVNLAGFVCTCVAFNWYFNKKNGNRVVWPASVRLNYGIQMQSKPHMYNKRNLTNSRITTRNTHVSVEFSDNVQQWFYCPVNFLKSQRSVTRKNPTYLTVR